MGRGKLKLQFISNLKARCKDFERRKKSVEKAAKDLSTLCGLDVAMVVYSPDLHAGTPITWSSHQQSLPGLLASFNEKAPGPGKKTYTVADFLKEEEKEKMESEDGKFVLRAVEEDRAASDRAMEEGEDRAGLVAQSLGGDVREGETGLLAEPSSSSSGPVIDQETWTYEQLSAANFDCYTDPMMNYGGVGDVDMSNGGGMCLNADAEPLVSSSEPFSFGSYDFDFVSSSEFLDLDSCFSLSPGGGQSSISAAADWFLNDEEQSGGDRFMTSPLVLAT